MSREAFEAWALRNTSASSAHDMAWAAWQAALAQPQAEPTDYYYEWDTSDNCVRRSFSSSAWNGRRPNRSIPLYAAPQAPIDGFGGNLDAAFDAVPAAPAVPAVLVSWDRLRTLMDGIPTREEFIGGQRQQYVAKEAVMGWLHEGQLRAEREAAAPAVQPLTEDEIYAIAVQCTIGGSLHEDKFARAIEAHHGIKGSKP